MVRIPGTGMRGHELGSAGRGPSAGEAEAVDEEVVAAEAGVARPSVGVQDPEGRSPAGWAGAVARDHHLRSLADHVPAEPDPRSTGQLQPDPGRLADRTGQAASRVGLATGRDARRLQHDEGDPGPARQRGEPPESIGESRSRAARFAFAPALGFAPGAAAGSAGR